MSVNLQEKIKVGYKTGVDKWNELMSGFEGFLSFLKVWICKINVVVIEDIFVVVKKLIDSVCQRRQMLNLTTLAIFKKLYHYTDFQ